jgi:hypothetical protein
MDVSKEIQEVLNVLAEKFGATGEHLWRILVKQQYVDFFVWAIPCILLAIFTILYARYLGKSGAWKSGGFIYDNDYEPLFTTIFVFAGLFCFIALIISFMTFGGLINPEYYALKEIMSMIP